MKMKVVTTRKMNEGKEELLRDIAVLLRTIRRLRGDDLVPKGVYRFSTHEEAEEWMIRRMAVTHVHRNSKT